MISVSKTGSKRFLLTSFSSFSYLFIVRFYKNSGSFVCALFGTKCPQMPTSPSVFCPVNAGKLHYAVLCSEKTGLFPVPVGKGFLNKLKRMTELSSLHLPVNSLYYTIFIVVCIVEKHDRFLLTKIKEVIT